MCETYFWCAVTLVCVRVDALGVNWGLETEVHAPSLPDTKGVGTTVDTRRRSAQWPSSDHHAFSGRQATSEKGHREQLICL